jgi:Carboxypeptidase regulatory-like domain
MVLRMQFLPAIFLLLVLLVTADILAQGQSGIKGTVTDKFEHAPIRSVFVLVHSNKGNDVHVRTDGAGTYAVHLPPGVYDVFLSAPGFSPACSKVEIHSNGMTSFDAVLEANTLGMED